MPHARTTSTRVRAHQAQHAPNGPGGTASPRAHCGRAGRAAPRQISGFGRRITRSRRKVGARFRPTACRTDRETPTSPRLRTMAARLAQQDQLRGSATCAREIGRSAHSSRQSRFVTVLVGANGLVEAPVVRSVPRDGSPAGVASIVSQLLFSDAGNDALLGNAFQEVGDAHPAG